MNICTKALLLFSFLSFIHRYEHTQELYVPAIHVMNSNIGARVL